MWTLRKRGIRAQIPKRVWKTKQNRGRPIKKVVPRRGEISFRGPDYLAARAVMVYSHARAATVQMNPEVAEVHKSHVSRGIQAVDVEILRLHESRPLPAMNTYSEHMSPLS